MEEELFEYLFCFLFISLIILMLISPLNKNKIRSKKKKHSQKINTPIKPTIPMKREFFNERNPFLNTQMNTQMNTQRNPFLNTKMNTKMNTQRNPFLNTKMNMNTQMNKKENVPNMQKILPPLPDYNIDYNTNQNNNQLPERNMSNMSDEFELERMAVNNTNNEMVSESMSGDNFFSGGGLSPANHSGWGSPF
jgi:hypothetical protein